MSQFAGESNTIEQRNVEAIARMEREASASRTTSDRVADAITAFCGTALFVWMHVVWFGVWLTYNSLPTIPDHLKFDKPPFSVLTTIVSLEAIFLSAFILISQNHQQRMADLRNHLDLQVNLLAEQESTKTLVLVQRICDRLQIDCDDDEDIEELQASVEPESLMKTIADRAVDEAITHEKRDNLEE